MATGGCSCGCRGCCRGRHGVALSCCRLIRGLDPSTEWNAMECNATEWYDNDNEITITITIMGRFVQG